MESMSLRINSTTELISHKESLRGLLKFKIWAQIRIRNIVPGPQFSSLHVLACGLDLVPNMFTDVSHYTDWIQKAMATASPRAR
jgi:hypothetical protein